MAFEAMSISKIDQELLQDPQEIGLMSKFLVVDGPAAASGDDKHYCNMV